MIFDLPKNCKFSKKVIKLGYFIVKSEDLSQIKGENLFYLRTSLNPVDHILNPIVSAQEGH